LHESYPMAEEDGILGYILYCTVHSVQAASMQCRRPDWDQIMFVGLESSIYGWVEG
jgi:hypothetical protein